MTAVIPFSELIENNGWYRSQGEESHSLHSAECGLARDPLRPHLEVLPDHRLLPHLWHHRLPCGPVENDPVCVQTRDPARQEAPRLRQVGHRHR